jgi:capsular polysaccharide biosynthesis protein
MELNDVVRRVLGQHRWMLLYCVLAGLAVGLALDLHRPRTYTASTRLALDTEDPKTQPESAAIADIAKAIATTPNSVDAALRSARLVGRRDPAVVAADHVDVTALGSSGIVELTVSDSDRRAAAMIANALARQVIATRLAVTRGEAAAAELRLDRRIVALNRAIANADAGIDRLTIRAASQPDPQAGNSLRSQRDEMARRRDFLAEQRSVVESERASLLGSGAAVPRPDIIGSATPPLHADPAIQAADIVLGGMLGLVIALGIAGLRETLRPTLVDVAAVGDALDAPVLGTLSRGPRSGPPIDELVRIAARLRLAARGSQVRHVGLVAAAGRVDVEMLAVQLEQALASVRDPEPVPTAAARRHGEHDAPPPLHVRVYEPESPASANGAVIGLVAVARPPVALPALSDTQQLLRVSGAPLLGVVGVPA